MKDSNSIIEITPAFMFFSFRGYGCFIENEKAESERETYINALETLPSYIDEKAVEVQRAKKEVEEQIADIGQLYLF